MTFAVKESGLHTILIQKLNAAGEELSSKERLAEVMRERHGLQLSYYAKAIELLYGKPCRRICVYSTHSATLYDIDVKL